ncbi:SDR family oxidoreductase (plasmid) [Lichenicola cladoniae]|uniref:SDR family oxidoreductase n=1 Tax=Lichenicola cladoniae TaxID=1484109 RepID=A0A6M8HXT5_9PROT|nr:SDR family oxidoreductase [Lichenicola cladoniae]NPD67812.1 SDR family oxidoreductase [Acetobacteraceae bacterium]QKE93343.1 SDR family oxidoreductase [Lichenicola cladoniae]
MNTPFSTVTSSFSFRNRQALISGASSGIGLELARGFKALGASVLATGSSLFKLSVLGEVPVLLRSFGVLEYGPELCSFYFARE